MSEADAKPKYLTLILGAGASKAYGFPQGDELVRNVARRMINYSADYEKSMTQQLGKQLRLYDPLSIDSYLSKYFQNNPKALKLYKTFIVAEILYAHQVACCNQQKQFGQDNNQNWMRFLVPELIDLFTRKPDQECPIKIVTFNYDLSLEYCLDNIIANFESDANRREAFLKWVFAAIVHVYGYMGCYTWQSKNGPNNYTNIWHNIILRSWHGEAPLRDDDVLLHAETFQHEIRVIGETERIVDEDAFSKAKDWISLSRSLVFTGYAFDKDNNARLELEKTSQNATNVIVGLYNKTKRIDAVVKELFTTGISTATHCTEHRHKQFNPSAPGNPILLVHDHITTYDLFREELVLGELYG